MNPASGRKIVAGAGMAAAVYGIWARPRLMRWGATDDEVTGPYPGADVVPEGHRAGTMAVTIEAPPEEVWPWLVQMGWNRGGWYSWDRLDNAGRPSARQVHPEWQDLAIGDHVHGRSPGGLLASWEVPALEPNRFLGLHRLTDLRGRSLDRRQPRPAAYLEGLWGFHLYELPGGHSRLVIGYQAIRPRWLERFVFGWSNVLVVWIMQARMLAVLKRNIEQAANAPATRTAEPAPAGRRRMFGGGAGYGLTALTLTSLELIVGGISQQPRVIDGQVQVRDVLNLTLAIDHDVIDGAPAARFAAELRQAVETRAVLTGPVTIHEGGNSP